MASSEMLWHLEGREQQKSTLDNLAVADISKRPESVAAALRQSQKANEVAGRIVWPERANQIQQNNPHDTNPNTLSKDIEIAKIQWAIYESLGIDKNTDSNNPIKKFTKWMIDGLFVGNVEIVMMIKNEGIEKFLTAIRTQFSSLEGIGQILKAVWMSIWDLATGDAYKRWKSLAELWLITTGAGAAGSLAKYAGKTAIRASVRVGEKTLLRTAASQTLHAIGRTSEVVGTWLQLPAKWVKKVAVETGKVVGTISEKTGVSATLRTGARVWSEVYERSGAKKVIEWTKQAIKSTLDTSIATLGATEAIQVVRWKVGEILEKSSAIFEWTAKEWEKYTLELIAKLGDTERLSVASELLWRVLAQEEKIAILKAHSLWEWWIGNYSLSDIRSKADILKQAWFSPEERRILMEKWVCGKEIITKISPEEVARQASWLEKLWFPENLARDMIESWLLNQKFLWWDLLRRFEALEQKWVDYHKMIDEVIKSLPKLSREEALLIFSYTDETIYRKLNAFMRWDKEVLQGLTSENILATQKLIQKLETALEKMPNLEPWKDGFVFRWDKAEYWQWAIWSELHLKDFKSVSNNTKDIFLWWNSSNDAKISIIWLEWRVKDISSLAIAVNFGDHPLAKLPKTQNEWILLPNSHVLITWKGTIEEWWKIIYQIEVKQLK